MSSIVEIGNRQVDVHYATTGLPGRVEENFEEFFFQHDDHYLEEVLQDQESVYQSLQASNGNDSAKASTSGGSDVNHGQSDEEEEGEPSQVPDVQSQIELDEAFAIHLQFHESFITESTGTDTVNREVDSTDTSPQSEREDNVEPDHMSYEALLSLGEDIGTESRGLSEEVISYLPTKKYSKGGWFSKNDNTEECVICRVVYKNRDKLIILPCQHLYHSKCITPWLKLNKACPVCKEEVFGS